MLRDSVQGGEELPVVEEDQVVNLLRNLNPYKFMVQDGMHLRVLGELANFIVKLPSIVFERLCRSGEVPDN